MKFIDKLRKDIQESYNELVHKVSWPSQKDLLNNTVLVMSAAVVSALVIWVIDLAINGVMGFIYGLHV